MTFYKFFWENVKFSLFFHYVKFWEDMTTFFNIISFKRGSQQQNYLSNATYVWFSAYCIVLIWSVISVEIRWLVVLIHTKIKYRKNEIIISNCVNRPSMRERKWRMIKHASLRKYNHADACAVHCKFGKSKTVRECCACALINYRINESM